MITTEFAPPAFHNGNVLAHGLSTVIDAKQALSLVVQVVKGNEDRVYRPAVTEPGGFSDVTCRYEKDSAPSCLVGKALALAGVGTEVLTLLDTGKFSSSAGNLHHFLPITPDADAIFRAAQQEQDTPGVTWGRALSAAVSVYVNL